MKDIVRDGDPVLRKVAKPLTFPLSDHYKKLADDMMEYLVNSQDPKIAEKHQLRAGVGLAAPQVGESVQMAALLVPDDEGKIIFKEVYVNPEIISESVRQACLSEGEGCLSINREVEGIVPRRARITVEAYDMEGKKYQIRVREDISIAFQHEIDHLNGILFIDRIDPKNPYKNQEKMREI